MTAADYNRKQIADGVLTPEHVTELVTYWQATHGLEPDGRAGPGETIPSIEASATSRARTQPAPVPSFVIDIRRTASTRHVGPKRARSAVTGICLHQTACVLGERPERYETVGAHIGITRSGKVIWMHSFEDVVYHGNGWNDATIGIEIDGLYAGIEGDLSTVWDDPSTARHEQPMALTGEAITAACETIRWLSAEYKIKALVAHRQSSASRRNDPGSAIWKAIALPMHAELELGDGGIGFKLGDGRAIPEAWDPRCRNIPY